jgi:hypothetical protein
MAKVVRFHETGGPEVVKIEEVDLPGGVRKSIMAASKMVSRKSTSERSLHMPRIQPVRPETADPKTANTGIEAPLGA